MRFCQAACTTTRTICRTAFISGKLQKRCEKRALRVCLTSGGTCIHSCDTAAACRSGDRCVSGQCIMDEPCRTACGAKCCGGDYPNCGPDGHCWTRPCQTLCGDTCCGGRFPDCGPDGHCWIKPCETLCGNTCCGGDYPICDAGSCRRDNGGGGGDGFPTNLPPGTYALTACLTGAVSIPCQAAGTIPLEGLAQFESAIRSALDQWLAATAGSGCARGAAAYSAFNGSAFTATATVTCGPYTATLELTVRHL